MKYLYSLLIILSIIIPQTSWGQITAGQTDDFTDGTNGWLRGSSVDGQLELTADGSGSGGKLVTFNQSQWSGDYLGENISLIRFTISNPSDQNLSMRIAIGNGTNASSGTWYASTEAVAVNAGASGQVVEFPLGSEDLSLVAGTSDYETVLSAVVTLRILHSESPSAQGDAITAGILLDNIEAVGSTSAVGEISRDEFRFYPNPAINNLTIESENTEQVGIYDLTGKLYRRIEINPGKNNIDITDWVSGIYILRVRSNKGVVSKRLIVE